MESTTRTSRTGRWLAPALIGAGLVAAYVRSPQAREPRFVVPPPMDRSERPVLWSACQWRALPNPVPSAHACSLAVAPDGALLVGWFGGEREGARDVAIHMTRLPERLFGPWRVDHQDRSSADATAPAEESWVSLTREQLQPLVSRVIRKIGNPVLWFDGAGRLHMHVVSVSYGGWSGSAVNQLVSDDLGHTWNEARRLVLSPFFNLSTLVRTQPQVLEDGSIGLPAYHEFVQKWGVWARMDATGSMISLAPMQRYEGDWLQPAVAVLSPTQAVAALRAGTHAPRRIGWSATEDGGRTWPLRMGAAPTEIPNPDASVAMIRLSDGSLLLACNPLESGRNRLQLWRSRDGGGTWTASHLIDADPDPAAEFSYPALVQDRMGRVHLGYTLNRKQIALFTCSMEWLDQPADSDTPAARRVPQEGVAP